MMASIDDVAIARSDLLVVPFSRARDRVFLLSRDPALLHRPLGKLRQRFLDPSKALVEILLLDLKHGDVEASHRANLRDARTHQPAT